MTGPAADAPSEAELLDTYEAENRPRRLSGRVAGVVSVLAALLCAYAVYWGLAIVETRFYRISFLLIALLLAFLMFPAGTSGRARVGRVDLLLMLLSLAALAWPLVSPGFAYRVATPSTLDVAAGVLAVLLVLEATRRSVGWILPVTAAGFIVYAFVGPWLDRVGLGLLAHRGYGVARVTGSLYMGLDGLFGVPLDVAATYIVLFSLYAAVLDGCGASRFFLDWSFAALGRSRGAAAPARTVTAAGFLLGTVSGSGVATTVSLGSASWPLLRRAGYPAETAGAILSAAGIGAILSPPTLGAAAFLIAEFLKIPYLQVLVMVSVPTVLYYFSILLMVEADARRLGLRVVNVVAQPLGTLTRQQGYHFISLVAVALLMALGMSPFRAVLWATLLALASTVLDRSRRLGPRALFAALDQGGRGVVAVTATTACAGLIVGITTLTGLGLKAAGLIVDLAGGNVLLTVVFAALAVWVVGLAVPVTASYVLAAVMIAPALTQVGVPETAAHMFVFYYAVLSEVSPPTALSPMAAAALTGGDPLLTMLRTWKYTLPAFLVPFAFTTSPEGLGLLLQASPSDVLHASTTAALGVAALAGGLGGFVRRPATRVERVLLTAGGLLLFHGSLTADVVGAACALLGAALQWRSST